MKDRATLFAYNIVNGIPTDNRQCFGRNEILCCQRHLNDLERQGTEEFPYIYDEARAKYRIEFSECLTMTEGKKTQQLKLHEFQAFIRASEYAWVHKDTGFRRFRTSYKQFGRKNGKSLDNGENTVFYSNFDNFKFAQIYCTATKELEARIVLKEAIKFINSDNDLAKEFKIQDYKNAIIALRTEAVIKALGRDSKTINGLQAYFASVDEYFAHPDNQMYKQMVDSAIDLDESLVSVITTAGFNLNAPCCAMYEHCVKVLEGSIADETQFIYIADLDKEDKIGDNIWNENCWQKAHPRWHEAKLKNIRAAAITAKSMGGSELANFMTKLLNIWVSQAESQYMNMEHWKSCGCKKTLEDMRGQKCFIGIDLSSGGDLTSTAYEFPRIEEIENKSGDKEDVKKYFIHSHSFMPYNRLEEHMQKSKFDYRQAVRRGELTLTETNGGVMTDYKYILADIKKNKEEYNLDIIAFAIDPHNAAAFLSDLCEIFGVEEGKPEDGKDAVIIIQSARYLNEATVDLRLAVEAGYFEYNEGDQLLTYTMANAKTTSNSFGEIKIEKSTPMSAAKIDPVAAIIDSHHLARYYEPKVNIYEQRGMRIL